eukprot:TRINITY_DN799_c0_g1_i1.p1 TRINITY_DN799_c0_g1~~TRINITY_DN799_c0_g1_i1.p1  ORF type:complete len:1375 (+),score=305.50 TRINITY_DN799_c0_g1_i1:156-4280(+)
MEEDDNSVDEGFRLLPSGEKQEVKEILLKSVLKPNTPYYVVDSKWYQLWKDYVCFDAPEDVDALNVARRPGPIDNRGLLASSASDIQEPVPDDDQDIPSHSSLDAVDQTSNKATVVALRPGLDPNFDVVLLPEDAYFSLKEWYGGGPDVKRHVIVTGYAGEKLMIDLYPVILEFYKIGHTTSHQPQTHPVQEPHFMEPFHRLSTIKQVRLRIATKLRFPPHKGELYLLTADKPLQLAGDLLMKTLDDLAVEDGAIFAFKAVPDTLSDRSSGSSSWSGHYAPLPPPRIETNREGAPIAPGVTGLYNLGNTCFMNSVLQCLSNTEALSLFFRSESHLPLLNTQSPLGSKGHLARQFGLLMRELWSKRFSYVVPRAFKSAVGQFAPQFSGFQQHDAQEFLALLLDGLHEDVNVAQRTKAADESGPAADPQQEHSESTATKTSGEPATSDCSADVDSSEDWRKHTERHSSFLVDLFHGQFRSSLSCDLCKKTSVKFDPFTYLSVPIPTSSHRMIEVTFWHADRPPIVYGVRVPKISDVSQVRIELAKLTGLTPDQIVLADVYGHRAYPLVPYKHVMDIRADDKTHGYEVLAPIPQPAAAPSSSAAAAASEAPLGHDADRPQLAEHADADCADLAGKTAAALLTDLTVGMSDGSHAALLTDLTVGMSDGSRGRSASPDPADDDVPEMAAGSPIQVPAEMTADFLEDFAQTNSPMSGCSPPPYYGPHPRPSSASVVQPKPKTGVTNLSMLHGTLKFTQHVTLKGGRQRSLLGWPMMVSFPSDTTTNRQLHALVQRRVRLVACGHSAEGCGCAESTEPPVRMVLRVLGTGDPCAAAPCGLCKLDGCLGCELPLDDSVVALSELSHQLVLDWTQQDLATWAFGSDGKQKELFTKHVSLQPTPEESAHERVSLLDCVRLFFTEERLGVDDKWLCPHCRQLSQAVKKLDVARLPEVLIVHLKRFQYSSTYRSKLKELVSFPIDGLDLSAFVHGPGADCTFQLFAVSSHSGGMSAGHYTACARGSGTDSARWFKYNDSTCMEVKAEQVVSDEAYILFYRRVPTSASIDVQLSAWRQQAEALCAADAKALAEAKDRVEANGSSSDGPTQAARPTTDPLPSAFKPIFNGSPPVPNGLMTLCKVATAAVDPTTANILNLVQCVAGSGTKQSPLQLVDGDDEDRDLQMALSLSLGSQPPLGSAPANTAVQHERVAADTETPAPAWTNGHQPGEAKRKLNEISQLPSLPCGDAADTDLADDPIDDDSDQESCGDDFADDDVGPCGSPHSPPAMAGHRVTPGMGRTGRRSRHLSGDPRSLRRSKIQSAHRLSKTSAVSPRVAPPLPFSCVYCNRFFATDEEMQIHVFTTCDDFKRLTSDSDPTAGRVAAEA